MDEHSGSVFSQQDRAVCDGLNPQKPTARVCWRRRGGDVTQLCAEFFTVCNQWHVCQMFRVCEIWKASTHWVNNGLVSGPTGAVQSRGSQCPWFPNPETPGPTLLIISCFIITTHKVIFFCGWGETGFALMKQVSTVTRTSVLPNLYRIYSTTQHSMSSSFIHFYQTKPKIWTLQSHLSYLIWSHSWI